MQLPGFVEDIFVSAVMEHPQIDQNTKLAVVRAVNKVRDFLLMCLMLILRLLQDPMASKWCVGLVFTLKP